MLFGTMATSAFTFGGFNVIHLAIKFFIILNVSGINITRVIYTIFVVKFTSYGMTNKMVTILRITTTRITNIATAIS